MKKTILLLLTFSLLLTLCMPGAYADGAAISLDSCEADPGGEISVPIRLVNNPGIISAEIEVVYDAEVLDWVGVQAGDYAGTVGDYEIGIGQSVAWFARDERTDIAQDGVLVTLSFKVKEETQAKSTQISVSYDEENVFDAILNNVYFEVVPGVVTIKGTAQSITIAFDANGGTGAPESVTGNAGEEIKLPAGVPSRGGYTFLGWAESAEATAAAYQPGGSLTKDADVTLYAVWQQLTPDLTLPTALTTIESEAFAGGGFASVLIPPTVTTIASDAFGDRTELVIFGTSGSYAETFAGQKHFTFIPAA